LEWTPTQRSFSVYQKENRVRGKNNHGGTGEDYRGGGFRKKTIDWGDQKGSVVLNYSVRKSQVGTG